MSGESIRKQRILRFQQDRPEEALVSLVKEVPFSILLNGREMVTLLCTGHHLDELAMGFLRSEGLLESMEEVKSLQVDEEAGIARVCLQQEAPLRQTLYMKRTLGSGCGRASLYYRPLDALQIRPIRADLPVTAAQIRARMLELNRRSHLYVETRCTHNAALANAERILVSREDIGRHNAADMIVGHALLEGLLLSDKLLLTTGRASSEIVLKAARVGIPVLVSRSAPTSLGVEIAQRVGMTLAGYVRSGRMNVYCHPQRLQVAASAGVDMDPHAHTLVKGMAEKG